MMYEEVKRENLSQYVAMLRVLQPQADQRGGCWAWQEVPEGKYRRAITLYDLTCALTRPDQTLIMRRRSHGQASQSVTQHTRTLPIEGGQNLPFQRDKNPSQRIDERGKGKLAIERHLCPLQEENQRHLKWANQSPHFCCGIYDALTNV